MYTRAGRWGGRLTARPLPVDDRDIDGLRDGVRGELAAVWLARAASERRVADAFAVIRADLHELQAGDDLVLLAARAVDDEHRHAELARVVASRFAGAPLDPPPRLALVVPEHPGAPDRLRRTLHVLGHCALNETFASAFLEAALERADSPLAHAALRELLSDEIDHARIGWAHLASLRERERAEIVPWLLPLVRANLAMWRTAPRGYPSDPAAPRHGAPPALAAEEALLRAVRELVLPGFERFRLPTEDLRAWLEAGASTG